MKRTSSLYSTAGITAVLLLAIAFTSWKNESQNLNSGNTSSRNTDNSSSGAPHKIDITHVYLFVEDANMQPPTGDNTLLFDNRGHTPIMALDGHQVTLGEYNKASGWADVKCINEGTHTVFHMQGLIPNGVYT